MTYNDFYTNAIETIDNAEIQKTITPFKPRVIEQNLFLNSQPVTEEAYKDVGKIIGVNKKFLKNLVGLGETRANAVLDNIPRPSRVGVQREGESIIGIYNPDKIGFDSKRLLEDAGEVCEKNNMEISRNSTVSPDGNLAIRLQFPDGMDPWKMLGMPAYEDDTWKSGIEIRNSETGQFKSEITSFLERLICENGMTDDTYSYSARFNSKEPYAGFVNQMSQNANQKIFNERFRNSMLQKFKTFWTTEASVQELIDLQNLFSVNEAAHGKIQRVIAKSPRYLISTKDGKSKKWNQTANSGIKAYDLLNISTFLNTHVINNEHEGIIVNRGISKQFFNKPTLDLAGVAPKFQTKGDVLQGVREELKLS